MIGLYPTLINRPFPQHQRKFGMGSADNRAAVQTLIHKKNLDEIIALIRRTRTPDDVVQALENLQTIPGVFIIPEGSDKPILNPQNPYSVSIEDMQQAIQKSLREMIRNHQLPKLLNLGLLKIGRLPKLSPFLETLRSLTRIPHLLTSVGGDSEKFILNPENPYGIDVNELSTDIHNIILGFIGARYRFNDGRKGMITADMAQQILDHPYQFGDGAINALNSQLSKQ